jgi:hypothetical protein
MDALMRLMRQIHHDAMNTSMFDATMAYLCSLSMFWDDVRRAFMQRLYATLHGTLGSYFREGNADAVACLPVPRAWVCGFFPSLLLLFALWLSLLFFILRTSLLLFYAIKSFMRIIFGNGHGYRYGQSDSQTVLFESSARHHHRPSIS